jgi:hypothetical protein
VKKKRAQSKSVTIRGLNPLTGDLIQRAQTAEVIYGTLRKIATPGPDGVQRAYVDVQDNGVTIDAPANMHVNATNAMYGIKPTSVASETEPFPLIPKYDEPDFTPDVAKEHRAQLRQILSRLVDEV